MSTHRTQCVALLALSLACSVYARDDGDWLSWDKAPDLPVSIGLSGAFIGLDNGVMILAGGSNFPEYDGPKTYHDEIYVLESADGGEGWREAGRLPRPVAHGAAVPTPNGLLCMGGKDSGGNRAEMFLLAWDAGQRRVSCRPLTVALPAPRSDLGAAKLGKTVYVAAGNGPDGETRTFWAVDLPSDPADADWPSWQSLDPWPGPARFGASLTVQNEGDRDCVYLFSGKGGGVYLTDGYRYDPRRATWSPTAPLPRAALLAPTVAVGQSHILVFSGSDGHDYENIFEPDYAFATDVLSYHTITDTWAPVGRMPSGVAATAPVPRQGDWLIPGGEIRPKVRTATVLRLRINPPSSAFGAVDYVALIAYLTTLLGIGFYFSGREKTTGDFFLGGRRIPWWAAGLSLMATQVSSIGFMAVPAKSFATDWAYFTGVATWLVVVPIVTVWFIPLFRKLNVTTAYEYLEDRFDVKVRSFGAVVFSLMQLGRMAVVLYLPAVALSAATGMSAHRSILIMGVLATAYTAAGGMEAVVWTDVIQAIVLIGGALVCILIVLFGIDGGVPEFYTIASASGKFRLASFGGGIVSATLWVVLVGNVFMRLSGLISDQAVVQRYLTTKDEKQAARALWLDAAVSIPWALIVFGLGTALFVFYKTHPEMLAPATKTIDTVPAFISRHVPAGLRGIIIAAIFAAAMSSLDSSMHSVATTWTTDFYGRFKPRTSDRQRLRFARILTLLLGLFGTVSALWLASSDIRSMWDFFLKIVGLFGGALCGVFILGLVSRRANAAGALAGVFCSTLVVFAVWYKGLVHPLLYSAVGVVVCLIVGWSVSLLAPAKRAARYCQKCNGKRR